MREAVDRRVNWIGLRLKEGGANFADAGELASAQLSTSCVDVLIFDLLTLRPGQFASSG
jgi:hypothetical protein